MPKSPSHVNFPKHEPLTGGDYVCFRPPGCRRNQYGHVLAPLGSSEINAEIEGDTVRIQAEEGGAIYTVSRAHVTALHGKALDRARQRKQNRRKPLRSKARRSDGPATIEALVSPPRPAALRLIKSGPVQLVPVPKDAPPVRSTAYREFVRGRICIACEDPRRPVEAHHEGPHGLGVKCDDLLCIPLCAGLDGCHKFYTDKGHLPGLSRVASLVLMHDAQRVILVQFVARLLHLLTPPCLVGADLRHRDQPGLDLPSEEEFALMAEVGHA